MMNDEELNSMLNTIYVPEDAGEHADDLRKILARIPENWGRWVSCSKGWYPLIIELDQKIAEMIPDYQLHQVKEKFGTLRYYIGLSDLEPQCCIDIEATRPVDGPIDPKWLQGRERTLQEQYELDQWFFEFTKHLDTDEHALQSEALEPERERRRELMNKAYEVINEYENLSAKTCELCGSEAELKSRNYWYQTLCETCAEKDGYLPIEKDEEDGN